MIHLVMMVLGSVGRALSINFRVMYREEAEGKVVTVEPSVLLVVPVPRFERGYAFCVMLIRDYHFACWGHGGL